MKPKLVFVSWFFVGWSRIFSRYICFNFTPPPSTLSNVWLRYCSKYPYFRSTGSCKFLSYLATESPSTRVSFTRTFKYFEIFLFALQFGFCHAAFCTFVIAFLGVTSTQPSHAVAKKGRVPYIYITDSFLIYLILCLDQITEYSSSLRQQEHNINIYFGCSTLDYIDIWSNGSHSQTYSD